MSLVFKPVLTGGIVFLALSGVAEAQLAPIAPRQMQISQDILAEPVILLEPQQEAQLTEIQQKYDARITKALDAQPRLKAQMQADLAAIANQKDPALRRQMIAAYQKRFGTQYQSALSAGGVSLAMAAREMGAVAPQFSFSTSSPFTIKATARQSATSLPPLTSAPPSSPSSQPAGASRTQTINLRGSDFEITQNKSCTLASGSTTSSTGMQTFSGSGTITTGGCDSSVDAIYTYAVPAGSVATVDVVFDFEAASSAVGLGVGGRADARSRGSVNLDAVRNPSANRRFFEAAEARSFVFVMGAEADEETLTNRRYSESIPGPAVIRIFHGTFANTRSVGIVTGTEAEATSTLRSARITVTTPE